MFEAVLLCYFDRFGCGDESDRKIAIQKLCKWAYTVRLDRDYLFKSVINKYALGGEGNYTNKIPMFAKIKNAREHTEITHLIIRLKDGNGENSDPLSLRNQLVEL